MFLQYQNNLFKYRINFLFLLIISQYLCFKQTNSIGIFSFMVLKILIVLDLSFLIYLNDILILLYSLILNNNTSYSSYI